MNNALQVGWREWVALPELNIACIKAKVDTGARTSALHAFYTEEFKRGGEDWVRFGVHPEQNNDDLIVHCEALIIDRRTVTDSGGHREQRPVIASVLQLGNEQRRVEFTLTNRDSMLFRMLIGRTAMQGLLVSPSHSFILGGTREQPPEAM